MRIQGFCLALIGAMCLILFQAVDQPKEATAAMVCGSKNCAKVYRQERREQRRKCQNGRCASIQATEQEIATHQASAESRTTVDSVETKAVKEFEDVDKTICIHDARQWMHKRKNLFTEKPLFDRSLIGNKLAGMGNEFASG